MNVGRTIALCALAGTLAGFAAAQDSATKPSPAVDNTRINQRDRKGASPTADQQGGQASDRELSRNIRKAIVSDKSLSTYAHNVKVISENGMVTLKGPVRSEEEKQAIEAKAAEVAGAQNVTSQLEVKPKQ